VDNKAQWSLVAAAWVLAIGVIAIGVYAVRHFSAPAPGAPLEARAFGTPANPLCPVDGTEIVLGPDTPKVNFMGNTYYFCPKLDVLGRTHKALFLMDPLLYLTGKSGHPVAEPAPAAAVPVPAPHSSPTATATPVFAPH
jgi:YHS domain-containing protein